MALIAVTVPSAIVIRSNVDKMVRADNENTGLALAVQLLESLRFTQVHRGLSNLVLAGERSQEPKLLATGDDLDRVIHGMVDSPVPGFFTDWRKSAEQLLTAWVDLRASVSSRALAPETSFWKHTDLINQEIQLLMAIVENSGLAIHQNVEGYFLQKALFQSFVPMSEILGKIRGEGSFYLLKVPLSADQRSFLFSQRQQLDSESEGLQWNLKQLELRGQRYFAFGASVAQRTRTSVDSVSLLIDTALDVGRQPPDAVFFFYRLTETIEELFASMITLEKTLQRDLSEELRSARVQLLGLVVGLVALVLLTAVVLLVALRMQRARHRGDSRFRSILEAFPTGVLVSDRTGRILFANPAATALYLRKGESWNGVALGDLVTERERDSLEVVLAQSRQGVEPEVRSGLRPESGLRSDGSTFPCEVVRFSLENQASWFLISVVQDVSVRKSLEHQLAQVQKMDALGQLSGGMAHDFNNFLGIIVGNLELLERIVEPLPQAERRVKVALQAAERGAKITRRLLMFSRKQQLDPTSLRVKDAVTTFVELAQRTLGPDIRIEVDIPENLPNVFLDASEFETVLLNLSVNARDAMPDGGLIVLGAKTIELDHDSAVVVSGELSPGVYVSVKVSDTGSGIPRELLDKVFEPFFTTKERGKGTGLGLSMVYGFVTQSRGSLKIYSELGIGTSITMLFPVDASEKTQAQPQVSRARVYPGARALVVDDEPDLVEIATLYLIDMGFEVTKAADGPSAVKLGESQMFDLLLTDVLMPGGINGAQLAEILQSGQPDLKILLASGFPSQALVEQKHVTIPNVLLTKPYFRRDFEEAVCLTMERRSSWT